MQRKNEDEDLEHNPLSYITIRYCKERDSKTTHDAARLLMYQVANEHEEILKQSVEFCMHVLNSQALPLHQKDGILRLIGAMARTLVNEKHLYKDTVEAMFVSHVFPEFMSPYGFMRARACWILKCFAEFDNIKVVFITLKVLKLIINEA